MDNGKKNGLKILTTNDIRKHARDWTLAGDVGLLAHLEQFSENIINKTEETQTNFNELVDGYEELYTKVGNITNQFLALQNCQFVENRVYDEETPTEEKAEVKAQNAEDQEKLLLTQYKEAVEVGIKLLDTHFQEVQLPPNSDSDDEDEVSPGNSIIWKPKNPYTSRKFPFLIGSSEWWADDNVGLRPNKESVDTERNISESESDMESLKSIEKTMKSSSSSSMENIKSIPIKPAFMESTEDLFGFDKNEILKNNDDLSKGSSSLPEEPANFLPDFDKEAEADARKRGGDSEEEDHKQTDEKPGQDEIPTSKPRKVDNEFTRELMAKLVSVTSKTENGAAPRREKPEEPPPPPAPAAAAKPSAADSLFDETDDSNDLFSATITRVAEKAEGKKGLFFDEENDDELFKGENDLFSGSSLFEGDVFKKPESQFAVGKNESSGRTEAKPAEKREETPPKKTRVSDLFDDLDDDEDTLFAPKPVNRKPAEETVRSSAPAEKATQKEAKGMAAVDLGWDDDDEGLFETAKKPPDDDDDDDDLFGSSGVLDAKTNKLESRDKETKTDLPSKKPEPVAKPEIKIEEPVKKEPSLFDSNITKTTAAATKDAFDDPFGFSSAKDSTFKKISILDSEDEEEDDLFSRGFTEEKKPPSKAPADGGGDDNDDDDDALFGEKPKPPDSVSVSSSRSSLFDDVSASKSRLASVFEKDKPTKSEKLFAKEEKSSLFDDLDDDDLFSVGGKPTGKEKSPGKDKPEDGDLFKSGGTPTKLRTTKSDILRHSELFADDPADSDLFSEKSTPAKPKPPSSLSLKPKETGQTVGKLNIPDNLKVKFESVAKKISPGGGGKPPPVEKKQEETREEALGEPAQPSTLLKCPSKDRVKIPGKRRPQSRRARQEAIRNSGNWEQPVSSPSSLSQPAREPSPVVSNPLSPSTDEEDFFKVPELDKNFEREDQSIFKSDLFESSTADDNLLFDGAPVLSPLSPRKSEQVAEKRENPAAATPETETLFAKPKVASIFDDDDDDDDLNGSLFKASKPIQTGPKKTDEKSKKPLFDPDMDDEDDLFGGKSQPAPSKFPDKRKEGGEPKEKENSSFVDPLGLMSNDQ